MNWTKIENLSQLEEIASRSQDKTCVIFKHSTRCSISSMALNRFERKWSFDGDKVEAYFLDLISYRDLSNAIVERFDVAHESPQMLVIKNGVCVFNSSHNMINVSDIENATAA